MIAFLRQKFVPAFTRFDPLGSLSTKLTLFYMALFGRGHRADPRRGAFRH